MTRRVIAWLTGSILLLGVVAVWGLWTTRLGQRGAALSLQLEAERQRNFSELVTHVDSIQGLLGKGMAAGSVRQNMLYMGEVHRRASLATNNFMALPLPGPLSASTGKFLNQIGDFAFSISRSEAAGRTMDEKQRAELRRLQETSASLAADLQRVGKESARTGFRWVAPAPRLADVLMGWRTPAAAPPGGKPTQDQSVKSLLPGDLNKIGPQMDRLPVFAYDGPFSDHLQKRTPAMGGPQITEEEARTRAVSFLPDPGSWKVTRTSKRSGVPAVYTVHVHVAGGGTFGAHLDIAQMGGHLVSYLSNRPAGAARLDLNKAKELGRAYLAAHGFPNMVPTYGEAVDGFATIQYALNHRGVTIYPDQIKVRVALDTGEIVGADARSYVMSHRERAELEVPTVNREQARKAINPELQVQRVQLTVIPTETGDGEVLCYEFLGRMGNNTFLVYVNAKTGEEERILQMLITKNGTLTL